MSWWTLPTDYGINGVADFFMKYPSFIFGNYLAYGFVCIIWITSFILSMVAGTRKALAVASFITLIFTVYFMRLGLINPIILIALVILTIVGIIGGKGESNY